MIEHLSIYTVALLISALGACVSTLVNDRKCEIAYKVSVLFVCIFTSLKYYWGNDIASYVPYYENMPDIWTLMSSGWGGFVDYFEIGYSLFCSIAKGFGLSFWGLTLFINIVLFHSLYRLINLAPKYKCIIFGITFVVCIELAFNQIRQALSCAFFFYFICAILQNKSMAKVLCLAFCSLITHKSSVLAIFPVLFLLCLSDEKLCALKRSSFGFLCLIAIILLPIDLKDLFTQIAKTLNLDKSIIDSATDAFYGKKINKFLFPNILPLLIPAFIKDERTDHKTLLLRSICFIGNAYISIFLTYDRFLLRLQYFFLPINYIYAYDLLTYAYKKHKQPYVIKEYILLTSVIASLYSVLMFKAIFKGSIERKNNDNPTVITAMFKNEEEKEAIKKMQLFEASENWRKYKQDIIDHYK